jgi:signal transduction histidine kinase
MKIGRVFPDLLTPLGEAASAELGLERTVRRLVKLTRAQAGAIEFRPPRKRPLVVVAGASRLPAPLATWLSQAVTSPVRGIRVTPASPPGAPGRSAVLLRTPLGGPRRRVGSLALVGHRARLGRRTLPADFPRELGAAIERVWRLHQRTLRISVLNDFTRLLVSTDASDQVYRGFAEGVARLVDFDGIGISLLDAERGEFDVIDVAGRLAPRVPRRDLRMALAGTLLAELVAGGQPVRIDDMEGHHGAPASREMFVARGYRSVLLVPLVSRGGAIGAVTLAAHEAASFDEDDVEIVAELARPLASAIEQRRLLDESRRRAEELAALFATSQLITSRLELDSVLDRISRSVTSLIGSTGCGIGLLDATRGALSHAAAHGFRTEAWRQLSIPVGEGLIGACASKAEAIRVDDIRSDPRSARRDIDEREGIRSMLCAPLKVAGVVTGVISAFSTRTAAFSAHHQRVLEAFAEQAGMAIHNARLFEESVRRARETRALFEAGRAVTATLEVGETMRVIMEQARNVLGVASCGIMTLDPESHELVSVASLDLPAELVGHIHVREGEGITGQAVAQLRPVQSRDVRADDRVRYRELAEAHGLRAMLAVPLRVADRAVGALLVFRNDVHEFSPAEEELLVALADQAAIALEHARLYERLEAMVADRTRQLDDQRRFVEVVLETLPLGVFVLDAGWRVVRANREADRVLPGAAEIGASFPRLITPDRADAVNGFLEQACTARRVSHREEEIVMGAEARLIRLTAAPLGATPETPTHVIVLAEDITLARRLERQVLLTERLTTAGRLASGVAHELNNPLATIAGCAESLLARLQERGLAERQELLDFPHYLRLIEEEAYRCKEITGTLLQFVREPGSRRTASDVNALVQKAIELVSHQSRFAGSRIETELDPDLPALTVNEGQLRQVFLGLAANALEAMERAGTLTVRTRRARGDVEIEFEDEGPGIADDVLPRIFDPFFTTKPPGQGTGLGLAIAQGIVADHGGRIDVTSRVGKGSIFRVALPA